LISGPILPEFKSLTCCYFLFKLTHKSWAVQRSNPESCLKKKYMVEFPPKRRNWLGSNVSIGVYEKYAQFGSGKKPPLVAP
jgi:hypothetical protein